MFIWVYPYLLVFPRQTRQPLLLKAPFGLAAAGCRLRPFAKQSQDVPQFSCDGVWQTYTHYLGLMYASILHGSSGPDIKDWARIVKPVGRVDAAIMADLQRFVYTLSVDFDGYFMGCVSMFLPAIGFLRRIRQVHTNIVYVILF